MSLHTKSSGQRVKKAGFAVLAIAGVLAVLSSLVPTSGAWFFDSKHADIVTKTPNIGLELTSDFGTVTNGRITTTFNTLRPGESRSELYTIKNNGSFSAIAYVDSDGVTATGGTPGYDINNLQYFVAGPNGATQSLPVKGKNPPLSLEYLNPGESKTIIVTAALSSAAGNEWQNVSTKNTINVVLTQDH